MKNIIFIILMTLFTLNSFAKILSPENFSIKINNATLPSRVRTNIDGELVTLSSIGVGIRSKKIAFFDIKVYVGQFFVSEPDKIIRPIHKNIISLQKTKTKAIQLHFLRNVDSQKIEQSFIEALKVNNIDISEPIIKRTLDSVKTIGDMKEGSILTIVGSRTSNTSEVIYLESPGGFITEIKGPNGFTEKVFSIWLGRGSDPGMEKFQSELLGN